MCYEIKFAFTCPSDVMVNADGKPVKNVSDLATSQEYCAVVSISILKKIFCLDYLESILKEAAECNGTEQLYKKVPNRTNFCRK